MTGSMLRGLPFVVDDIGLGQDVSRYRINLVCSERARSLEWHRPPHIIKQRGGVGPYRRVCGLGCRRSALLVLAAFLPVFLRSGCHVLPVMKSRRRTAFPWLGTPAFGTNAAEAEDSADPACEHAVACKLIELTTLEVFVLHDQALGGSKGHRERVFGHRLRITAAVSCHGHSLGEFAQRNEIHASDGELDEPRAVQ